MEHDTLLTALTLLLTILIFYRSILLRKRTASQSSLIAEQTRSLEEIREKLLENESTKKREMHFQQNLQQAEVTTELQKARSSFTRRKNNHQPPERYSYAQSMIKSGIEAEEISMTLGISNIELSQLKKLSSICSNNDVL